MSEPRISVIIPVFNNAGVLAGCLASLKKQTFQDFEIITVDDGSATPLPNATIRLEKNSGAPAARNAGFKLAKGQYVLFLDADADLRPDALEKMVKTLEAHPEASFAYPSHRFGFKTMRGRPFDAEALKRRNYIHTSALICREDFPGFDESLKRFQDWDLFLTMAEQGKQGIWIDEVLFTIKPHGTMSQWVPSFMHDIPWPIFGWTPKVIKKYREAETIIREKHALPNMVRATHASPLPWFALIVLVEFLSVFAAFNPTLNSVLAVAVGVAIFVLSVIRPDVGFVALVVEIMIGSKGRLFVFGANAANDGGVSLRIILVAAFMLGWIVSLIREKRVPDFRRMLDGRGAYLFLAASVLLGVLLGFLRKQPFLIPDANAWMAYILLIPALDLGIRRSFVRSIVPIANVALLWLCAKSMALFYLFSHDFGPLWQTAYLWVRRTGVGEITQITRSASAMRVFLQSQIYVVLGSLVFAGAKRRFSFTGFSVLALCFAVILISFSRSFWIGLAAGFLVLLIDILRRPPTAPQSGRAGKDWMIVPRVIPAGLYALLMVAGLFYFPFPSSYGNLSDVFFARADMSESAAASRWELLPVLNAKIREAPLFGHGFGATVTYASKDPRVVASTGGSYTTYAFEWGWHDFAVKIGLFGVFAYLLVLLGLFRRLGAAGFVTGQALLVCLAVIHIFSPFLNHPLGIMVIILMETAVAVHAYTRRPT